MRKILALVLSLMMIISSIPAMAEEAEAVKTGLSFVTSVSDSKDGKAVANITITAVTVDDNGVITACVIDYVQGTITFDEKGVLTTDKTTEFASKNELGDDYGMRVASSISAEWNEQAAAFAEYCVGKTVDQLLAAEVDENGVLVDIVSTCTLAGYNFLPGVQDAVKNATHMGAKKGDVLKLTQVSTMEKSKDATADADGQAQVYTHVAAITLQGETITSIYIDAVQATVTFNGEGKITSDITAPVLSKNVIGDGYGMKAISPIGKEWYEQTAAFCEFVTGMTIEEAVTVAAAPAETDVISSCTIGTDAFLLLIVKAAD